MILQELTPESVVSPTECLQQEPFPSDVATSNYQDSLPIDRFIVDLPDAVGTLGQQMFFEASASGDLSRRTVPSSHVDLLADHLLPLLCTQLLRQDPGCCCNTGWCYRFLSHFFKGRWTQKTKQHMIDQVRGAGFHMMRPWRSPTDEIDRFEGETKWWDKMLHWWLVKACFWLAQFPGPSLVQQPFMHPRGRIFQELLLEKLVLYT